MIRPQIGRSGGINFRWSCSIIFRCIASQFSIAIAFRLDRFRKSFAAQRCHHSMNGSSHRYIIHSRCRVLPSTSDLYKVSHFRSIHSRVEPRVRWNIVSERHFSGLRCGFQSFFFIIFVVVFVEVIYIVAKWLRWTFRVRLSFYWSLCWTKCHRNRSSNIFSQRIQFVQMCGHRSAPE